MAKGLLIVLSGPSGVGKDTVIKELLKKSKSLKLSVSATTRKPRKGELDGKDYYFVDRDKFLKMAANSEFLEYAEYCDNFYGTPIADVMENINNGNDVLLEIEVDGGLQIKNRHSDCVSIFIAPPSIKDLRDRLNGRSLDSSDVIDQRVLRAKKELSFASQYDYIVFNDKVENCATKVLKIIDVEHMRAKQISKNIGEVLINE